MRHMPVPSPFAPMLVLCFLSACAPTSRRDPATTAPPTPDPYTIYSDVLDKAQNTAKFGTGQTVGQTFGRIDAIPGQPLILVLGSQPAASPPTAIPKATKRPATIFAARLADGRALGARTYAITTSNPLPRDASPDKARASWLNVTKLGAWAAYPWEQRPHNQPTLRIAAIDVPRDAIGPSLWVDGSPAPVQWLADPDSLLAPSPENWPAMLAPAAASDPALMRLLRAVAQSPLERWRIRLLIDGLATPAPDPASGIAPFSDPTLEAMARQVEQRWRLAFARLAQVEPPIASQVKARLSALAQLPGDGNSAMYFPAWPTDQESLERLRQDLLDPNLRRGDLPARAYQWLREQPRAAIWVADDGGTLSASVPHIAGTPNQKKDARPQPIAFVGIANLSDKPETVWLGSSDAVFNDEEPAQHNPALNGVPLAPLTSSILPAQSKLGQAPSIRVGRFSAPLPIRTAIFAARPPGFDCDNFAPDFTLQSWQYALATSIDPQWQTTVRILRSPAGEGPDIDARADGTAGWEALVTCNAPLHANGAADYVEFFFGPSAGVTLAYRISRSGEVARVHPLDPQEGPQRRVEVVERPLSWSFRLPISPAAVSDGRVLQVTLVRHDARGQRSCWPRPIFPWQSPGSAGRAALDLTTWDDLN